MKRFTYKRQIRVSKADLQAALLGRKRCTIRAGVADVAGEELFLSDGQNQAKVRVTNVDHSKTLSTLTVAEVTGEGFTSNQELEKDLKQYYRQLGPNDPLTVIWFELAM